MTEGMIFVAGTAFGAWFAWFFWLRYSKPKVEITIDKEVLGQINSAMVTMWLEARGLVWMPNGREFMVPKEKR